MKNDKPRAGHGAFLKSLVPGLDPALFTPRSALAAAAFFCGTSIWAAAPLTWDAGSGGTNTTGTAVSGSGNWDLVTSNWNNGTGDTNWAQISTTAASTNFAVFGGPDGAYFITNAVQIAVTNVAINNSGYSFSGSAIDLAPSGTLSVAAGKTATFNCNFASGNNAEYYWAGPGSVISVTGNFSGQQPRFAGPSNNCAYYFSGANAPSVMYILAPVYQTNGSLLSTASFFIGYPSTVNGTNYTVGSLTLSGGATAAQNGGNMVVARGGGVGTLTLLNGAINIGQTGTTARSLSICNDGSGTEHGIVNIYGGTVTVGVVGNPSLNGQILLSPGGSAAGEYSILNQTNGVINAWGGIEFGEATGTYSGGSSFVTNSGGSLYIGPGGIIHGGVFAPTNAIAFSGGLVGCLGGSWASSLPITLGTLNGNITFDCGDINNSTYNISLSGPLTGPGGLNVVGNGTLTLSATNNYAGSTVVSNGTLQIVTTPVASVSGPVTVDGTQGTATLGIQSNPGQTWSIGALAFQTFQSGTPALSFNFGALTPSTTVAPIQVSGSVNFQTTPTLTVGGTAIPTNTYPLITYTGTFTGTLPSYVSLPANLAGYVTNLAASKTIALVVTQSGFSAFLDWAVGNGLWDKSTKNWDQNGVPTLYADGDPVLFGDSASGISPIIVSNNIIVNPLSITADNLAKSYTITGKGSITGAGTLTVGGGGTLTLTETNTYSGGTVLSAGQLNINNGGDSSGLDSAIGTGPLMISGGTALDNTGGSNVTLIPSIQESWNGSFTYVGSTNSFDTGLGSVLLTNGNVSLTVVSNTFEVDGTINDNGNNSKLTKLGGGSLTLDGANYFGGGFELFSGQVNLGNSSALGSGICTIDGGVLDNYSGAALEVYPSAYFWYGSFAYLGSSNNLDLGSAQVSVGLSMTLNIVSNTFITEGNIEPGNSVVTKIGQGTWDITGSGSSAQNMNLTINQGTVLFDKYSGFVVNGAVSGLLVQSNALAFETGVGGAQINHGSGKNPVAVTTGGAFDLNGQSETVDAFNSTNGILRNSAVGGNSTLTVGYAGAVFNLSGTNCVFDVPDPTAVLNISAIVTGSGSLVMTGAGLLDLEDTNSYAGNTTITAGTLELIAPSLSSTSTVAIVSNTATINLNFVNNDTNQIGGLILYGVSQPPGRYNASTTPAITGTGTLLVVPPITTNPLPGPIQLSVSGTTFGLSWPTNLGWILQSQTNALATGLITSSNAWFDVSGSGSVTATNIVINPTNPAVFYRLRHP